MSTFLSLLIGLLMLFAVPHAVFAATLSTPTISSPASGASFALGASFTVTASTTSSQNSGTVTMTVNLPAGLSTSTANPQSCGTMPNGASCSRSWTVTSTTCGSKGITVSATGTSAPTVTSATRTITVACVPTATTAPTPTNTPAPTSTEPTATPPPGSTATPVPTGSTSTSPTTPNAGSTSSTPETTAGTTYTPTISLTAQPPSVTRQQSLSFAGSVSISSGSVSTVEYSITNGAQWFAASLSGSSFSFSTQPLGEGTYTFIIRAKSEANVYSNTLSSNSITIALSPPRVTLDTIKPNPTKSQTPTVSGSVSPRLAPIERVEISPDNGGTWYPVSGNSFTHTFKKLEDGNYQIKARAIDSVGNSGESAVQTLVVDTIPPVIGGNIVRIGPQLIEPTSSGLYSIAAGSSPTIIVSTAGGVTEAHLNCEGSNSEFSPMKGTNLWSTTIKFEITGIKNCMMTAKDGAENTTSRALTTFEIQAYGTVMENNSDSPVKNATVTVYYFDSVTKQWVEWDGTAYFQTNPQKTDDIGKFSFLLPPGKYYLEASARGYHRIQSEILTLSDYTVVNPSLTLRTRPFAFLSWIIPDSLYPPDTISTAEFSTATEKRNVEHALIGTKAPDFTADLASGSARLSQYAGKKLALSFFGPWAPSAADQGKTLTEAARQLNAKESILGISLHSTENVTSNFMRRGQYSFPVASDKIGFSANAYNVTTVPYHVFIDTKGIVREVHIGVLEASALIEKLRKLQ